MYTSILLYLLSSPLSPPLLPPPSFFLFLLLPLSYPLSPLLLPPSLFLFLLLLLFLCLLSHKLMWSIPSDNIPLICVVKVTFVSLTIIPCKYYIHV